MMLKSAYTGTRRLLRPLRRLWNKSHKRLADHPKEFLDGCCGVIHVGANLGQERIKYAEKGMPVIWIEPIPDVYRKLVDNIRDYPNQIAIQALITNKDGVEHTLHIANNDGQSSSIFDFAKHRDIWPDVHYTHDLNLTSETLPSALKRAGTNPYGYDGLILDTQGSELLILEGAVPILPGIKYIQTEAAEFESYRGGTTIAELREFLGVHGFVEARADAFARHPEGGHYYDVLFKKN